MRNTVLLFFFFSGCSFVFGQSFQKHTSIQSAFKHQTVQQIPTLDVSVAFTKKSGNSFYVYNQATGLNDSFTEYRDQYSYSRSTLVFSNQFRGIKVDSFNPYGVDNPGTAIVTGLLQLLF